MSWVSVAVDWVDRHSAAVQAVGSVLAVAIGFTTVVWQRHREEREAEHVRFMRARTLAVRLLPYVAYYERRLDELFERSGNYDAPEFPPAIRNAENELHLLEKLAPGVSVLCARVTAATMEYRGGRQYDPRTREIFSPVRDAAKAARIDLEKATSG